MLLQKAYYEVVRPNLGGDGMVRVQLSDTDSFLLNIRGHSEYTAMVKILPILDTSNMDGSPLFDEKNARRLGYLKNELPNRRILKSVGVKAKSYAILTDDSSVKKAAKGVTDAAKKRLTFDHFQSCLQEIKAVSVTQRSLRAKNHVNTLIEQTKVGFSSLDDKRYALCPIHTAPYGSYLIGYQRRTGLCYFCQHPDYLA